MAVRDCIDLVKSRITEAGWATPEELKEIERGLRAVVDEEFAKAKRGCVAAVCIRGCFATSPWFALGKVVFLW